MRTSDTLLAASAGIMPLAMQLDSITIPQSIPWWASLMMAALGPACVAFLSHTGTAVVRAAASYFKARAEVKKRKASELLTDKDPSNDKEGHKLLISAEAEKAAAETLERAADKMDEQARRKK